MEKTGLIWCNHRGIAPSRHFTSAMRLGKYWTSCLGTPQLEIEKSLPRKWSLKWWIYHHYILFFGGLPCYHKPTMDIFSYGFSILGRQVVTLLRWRVVELYYREVDELLYELSDLVGGWIVQDVLRILDWMWTGHGFLFSQRKELFLIKHHGRSANWDDLKGMDMDGHLEDLEIGEI